MGCSFISGAQHLLGQIANNPIVNAVVQFTPLAPVWDAANAVYQGSQGNILGALGSALGAASTGFSFDNPLGTAGWGNNFGGGTGGGGSGAGSGAAGSATGSAGAAASAPGIQAMNDAAILTDANAIPGVGSSFPQGAGPLASYGDTMGGVGAATNVSPYLGNSIADLAASNPAGAVPTNGMLGNAIGSPTGTSIAQTLTDINSNVPQFLKNLYSDPTTGEINPGKALANYLKVKSALTPVTTQQILANNNIGPASQNQSLGQFTGGASLAANGPQISRGPLSNNLLFKKQSQAGAPPTLFAARGGLARMNPGPAGPIQGSSPGQADNVPAMLSHGEFVIPADVVSHLGDGNNNAGALKLHTMMTNIRKAKGAPPSLPRPARPPQAYLKGV